MTKYYMLQHHCLREIFEHADIEDVKELCESDDKNWALSIFDDAFTAAGLDGRQGEYYFDCRFTHIKGYPALVYRFDQDFDEGEEECYCLSAIVVAADKPYYFLLENGQKSGVYLCAWSGNDHFTYDSFKSEKCTNEINAVICRVIEGKKGFLVASSFEK